MATPLKIPNSQNIFDNADKTGTGTPILVRDFKNLMLSLATSVNVNMTVKIQGSVLDTDTPPDFGSIVSMTNRWDYVACFNYQNPTMVIAGDTGFNIVSPTAVVENILVNTDGLIWLCATITHAASGSLSLDSMSLNDQ